MNKSFLILLIGILALQVNSKNIYTFEDALGDLHQIKDLTILQNGKSQIAVSAGFQGRVFTSTSNGMKGRSYGWFNKDVALSTHVDRQLHKIGGESRMLFGPEVGKFGTFFDQGADQTAENVKISPELAHVLFQEMEKEEDFIKASGDLRIRNANGYTFTLSAERKITLFDQQSIRSNLDLKSLAETDAVGFQVETWVENKSDEQWRKQSGLLSIWDIGCMPPTPDTIVIIPTQSENADVTVYFTEVDENRLFIDGSAIIYKGDASYLNKIGIKPQHCKDVFGSYAPEIGVLTIVEYHFANDGPYVNSHWEHTEDEAYEGDVINVFNGEFTPELDRDWPFYELETSSSAKELKPGEKMYHYQRVYHFEGKVEKLNEISKTILGVDLRKAYFE